MIGGSAAEIFDSSIAEREMREECGVCAVYGVDAAASLCYLGLYSLQHRGQESAGIVSRDKRQFYVVKEMGLVSEVFNPKNIRYLRGNSAIGHVRYSTTGSSEQSNIQPLFSKTAKGKIALAHNGNLTNAGKLYQGLKESGALFQSTVDSEVILHLLARSTQSSFPLALADALSKVEGAYSLVSLVDDGIFAARDPHGFRPLVLGKRGAAYVVASETCALDILGAKYIREIESGELIKITKDGIESFRIPKPVKPAHCVFEHVYFARPDSVIFGESVHLFRKRLGHILAKKSKVKADIVVAVPDSGNSSALGYSEESGIPFEFGITRNHYIGRTFIQPDQAIRNLRVKVKLNPIQAVLKDKIVVLIDDSIVRGTTSKQRVAAIRNAGAKEIHMRIASPPITHPCHFGIDTPNQKNLIASKKSIEEIREYIGADSLEYLTTEDLLDAIETLPKEHFCTACFTGNYPIKVSKNRQKNALDEGAKIKFYRVER